MLCGRWIENPYYQYFRGEQAFRHGLPFDRSSLTRWRQRLGEEQLAALVQDSLSVAHKTGAIAAKDLERVGVDTPVPPKAIAHPADARLMHRALIKLAVTQPKGGQLAAAHPRRQGLSRPQLSALPGLDQRPSPPRHRRCGAR